MWKINLNDISMTADGNIIPKCEGKRFIASAGSVLVCDDGTGFDTVGWQWIKTGL